MRSNKKVNYSRLVPTSETLNNLFDYCKKNKLGLFHDNNDAVIADFKFHITLIYSKITSDLFSNAEIPIYPIKFHFKKFTMFGLENDVLALHFKNNHIYNSLHNRYKSYYGHTHDHEPNPHLSIKGNTQHWKDKLDTLPTPNFPIIMNKIVHQIKVI